MSVPLGVITFAIISLNGLVSLYVAVCSCVDIEGEQNNASYATRVRMDGVLLAKGVKDELSVLEDNQKPSPTYESPFFGYGFYYTTMSHVSVWYFAGTFQVLKVALIACALVNAACSLAAVTAGFVSRFCWCSTSNLPATFVLLQVCSGGLFLTEMFLFLVTILAVKESSVVHVTEMITLVLCMVATAGVANIITSYYRSEMDQFINAAIEKSDKKSLLNGQDELDVLDEDSDTSSYDNTSEADTLFEALPAESSSRVIAEPEQLETESVCSHSTAMEVVVNPKDIE